MAKLSQKTEIKTTKRIPRPQGLSLIRDDNDKRVYAIRYYTQNNCTWMGIRMSIPEFTHFIGASIQEVLVQVNKVSGIMSNIIGDKKEYTKVAQHVADVIINMGLQDKYRADEQVRYLTLSQGASYKPFISGEVNRAISNSLSATSGLNSIFRNVFDPSILKEAYQDDPTQQAQNLQIEDVIQLLQDNNNPNSPLKSNATLDALRKTYISPNLPTIIAVQQEDFKAEDLGAGKGLVQPPDSLITHHERREVEGPIHDEA